MENNKVKNLINLSKMPDRDRIYNFVQAYQRAMNSSHNFYDTDITSVEAHTLRHICRNEGLTLTDIVNYWGRTKGTVSAQISSLEEKGLVKRERCKYNKKRIHIVSTEKGRETDKQHDLFDYEQATKVLDQWAKKYTAEEFVKFWEQLTFYTDFLNNEINKNSDK